MDDLTPAQKAAQTRAKNKAAKEAEVITEDKVINEDTMVSGPIIKSFGVVRKKDGWYAVTTVVSGGILIDIEETGPLMRAIAVEEFKISAQRHFESME